MSGLEDTNINGVKNKLGELNKTGEGEISKDGEGLSGINKGDGNSGFSEELDAERNNDYLKTESENDKTKVGEIDKAGETGTDEDNDKIKAGESKTESENDETNVDIQPNAETKVSETYKAGEVGETGINKGDGNSGFSEELDAERNNDYLKTESENDEINVDIQPNAETKVSETDKAGEVGENRINKGDGNSGFSEELDAERNNDYLKTESENDEYGSGNTMALSSREIADVLERRYPGQVSSSTIPPSDAKMVHMAGEKHPITGTVYDLKGFPIFDDVAVFDTRIPENIASKHDSEAHKRAATRSLRESLQDPDQKRNASLTSFTPEQLSAIKGGRAQIPGFTWHHHQDFSRMQLVPTEEHHKRTGHVGGEYMSKQ